eukprot:6654127-Prymnesium_polylepis.1
MAGAACGITIAHRRSAARPPVSKLRLQATCAWPMVRRKAVLERHAALRCLWHGVRVVGRSNR